MIFYHAQLKKSSNIHNVKARMSTDAWYVWGQYHYHIFCVKTNVTKTTLVHKKRGTQLPPAGQSASLLVVRFSFLSELANPYIWNLLAWSIHSVFDCCKLSSDFFLVIWNPFYFFENFAYINIIYMHRFGSIFCRLHTIQLLYLLPFLILFSPGIVAILYPKTTIISTLERFVQIFSTSIFTEKIQLVKVFLHVKRRRETIILHRNGGRRWRVVLHMIYGGFGFRKNAPSHNNYNTTKKRMQIFVYDCPS